MVSQGSGSSPASSTSSHVTLWRLKGRSSGSESSPSMRGRTLVSLGGGSADSAQGGSSSESELSQPPPSCRGSVCVSPWLSVSESESGTAYFLVSFSRHEGVCARWRRTPASLSNERPQNSQHSIVVKERY